MNINEKRRELIQQGIDVSNMSNDNIESEYNRLALVSAQPTEQAQEPVQAKQANTVLDLDQLASSLLTSGMDTFKQNMTKFIQDNTPAPVTTEITKEIIKETIRTITLDHEGNQIIPLVNPQLQASQTASKLFNLKSRSAGYEFPVCDYTEDQPKFYDMRHAHETGILRVLALACEQSKHVWLSGEKATGKTTLVQHIANATHRPFIRIQHHKAMEPKDLVGSFQIPDGKSKWHDGALTQALRIPHAIILLDEPTVNPAACELYQSLLDEGYLTIEETGERVHMAEGVTVFATDNTAGHGDTTGRYDGTMAVNQAFIDRFWVNIPLTYMSKQQEQSILNRQGLSDSQARAVADFAYRVREQVKTGAIEEPVSLRRLLAFADLIKEQIDQSLAFEWAILNHVRHDQDRESYAQFALAHMPDLYNV